MRIRRCLLVGSLAVVAVGCSSGGDNNGEAFCAQLRQDQAVLRGNPQDLAQLEALVAIYNKLADTVPSAIEDDWATLTDVFSQLTSLDMSNADQRDKAFALALSDEFKQASSNVEAYAATVCAVGLAPETTTTTAAP